MIKTNAPSYAELNADVTLFTNAARDKYGSDAYGCGYLSSILVQVLQDMPARQRKIVLDGLRKTTADLELNR